MYRAGEQETWIQEELTALGMNLLFAIPGYFERSIAMPKDERVIRIATVNLEFDGGPDVNGAPMERWRLAPIELAAG